MKRSLLTLLISCFATALYAQAPAWLWAKSAGGTSLDFADDIAVDGNGNIYVVGSFQSATIGFGTTTLTNAGYEDIFLVKYDPLGNPLWAKGLGGSYIDRGNHVAVDANGNVYIAGEFWGGGLDLGTVILTAAGFTSTFVAKYNSAGTLQWAKNSDGSGVQAFCNGFAVDAAGNCCVTGWVYNNSSTTNNPLIFGSISLSGIGLADNDAFIAKYDASGNVLWAKRASGSADDGGVDVALDKYGNCYWAGGFSSPTIDFGSGVSLTNPTTGNHVFAVKFNVAGNPIWARHSTSNGSEHAYSAGVDSSGAFYVAGEFMTPTLGFGSVTLTNAGIRNAYVVKYDTAGTVSLGHHHRRQLRCTGVRLGRICQWRELSLRKLRGYPRQLWQHNHYWCRRFGWLCNQAQQ